MKFQTPICLSWNPNYDKNIIWTKLITGKILSNLDSNSLPYYYCQSWPKYLARVHALSTSDLAERLPRGLLKV